MEDLTSKQLGQYRIVAPLGRGGMATVYKAYQAGMDRYVAIKVLPDQHASDPNFLSRFRQEAKVIANLEHPNILPVYDYGEAEGYPYLVMRLVEGGTLSDLLKGTPLPPDKIRTIISQVGEALDYAHAHGVIHRDIKPGNVLVDKGMHCLLTDFGIAKIVEGNAQFTVTGNFIGTPQYASPEQGLGQTLDGRSDIYSLGVILYEMATGKQPFDAETPIAVMVKHVHEPLPLPRTLNPAIPASLEKVLVKALAKDPRDRYATAGEMVRILDEAVTQSTSTGGTQTILDIPGTVVEQWMPDPGQGSQVSGERLVLPPASPYPARRFPAWGWIAGGAGALILLCVLIAAATGLARGLFSTNEKAINLTPTAPAALIALPANTTPTEALIATATLLSPTSVPPVGSDTIYVEYILDASGSMLELLQGKTKLAIAQDVLSERVAALPPDVHVGLRVYGHRVPYQQEEESCKDIELVVPIETGGAAQILTWLPSMQGQGMTPMSESIRLAAEDFTFDPDRNNSIILISDGMETCGDDPSEVAGYLRELGINFTIHVIGLGVDAQTEAQLSRLAEVGQGIYQDANSEQELKSALEEINQVVVQPAPVPTEQPTSPPTFTPLPEPNFDATSEGSVQASSTSSGYPASSAIDGDTTTSWFSRGPNIDGPTSTFQWTGLRDDLITSLTILSNKDHSNPSFRTGYGFDSVMVQILDAAGSIVFEETIELPGTPDPDVILKPGVVGRSVVLIFSGHESVDCGGIGELVVGVTR